MLNVRSRWLGPPLALLAITLAGCQVPAADKAGGPPSPVTMTLATGEGDPSEVASFVDAVRRLSGGSLTIEVKTAWRKGEATYETGLVKDVIAGKADIGVVGVRAFDEEGLDVTSFQGFVAPFLIDSYELQDRVLDSDVARRPCGASSRSVSRGSDSTRPPSATARDHPPAGCAADFEGATFGAREGHVVALTLEALGGTSRVFVPDQAAGLDGMEAHLALIGNAGYDRNAAGADERRRAVAAGQCPDREYRSVHQAHRPAAGDPAACGGGCRATNDRTRSDPRRRKGFSSSAGGECEPSRSTTRRPKGFSELSRPCIRKSSVIP